jgi:NAD(P)-dependent dehydrogenase (short-subunit alcohol dehydrogenase family)
MQDLKGRVAVVTGAASGIGLGLSRMFAQAGMNVALCDVRADELATALANVSTFGTRCIGLEVDVSDAAQVETAAARVEAELGRIDIACNNAGVVAWPRPVAEFTLADWDWILGVNLYGVINGVRAFLPRIEKHGEGGHIVNTASIGGFQVRKGRRTAAYAASKFGVVALSEGLQNDLEGTNIGVSVLAPGAVNTAIYRAPEFRPDKFGGPQARPNMETPDLSGGLHPDAVGRRVIEAIRANEFYIFTHVSTRDWLARRHARIIHAFEATEKWAATEAETGKS